MSLRIIDPGIQSSVQDLGRPGSAHFGVPTGGAADTLSLIIGNRLVGNEDVAAAIETAMRHCRVEFDRDVTFCVTGSVAAARLTEQGHTRAIEPYTAIDARRGARLEITLHPRMMRAYLCIAGGIDTPLVLGSRSAYLPASLGPYVGPLKTGDILPLGAARDRIRSRPRRSLIPLLSMSSSHEHVRVVRVPGRSLESIVKQMFRVLPQSNRMGVRLKGSAVGVPHQQFGITEGTAVGSIQLPSDAEPIILGVDRPTTGGYPVVATVIAADLSIVGQLAPGTEVRFQEVDADEALAIARRQRAMLDDILPPPEAMSHIIDLNCDLGEGMPHEHDEALMHIVTSVSIACGGHAGDKATMERTVRAAMKHGCRLGAHPSFPDRANFGRRLMSMPSDELERSIVNQISTLMRIARDAGAHVRYVKPHGALYTAAMTDSALADTIARAVRACEPALTIMGMAGAPAVYRWQAAGFTVITEAFADRRYEPDGRLRARDRVDALITDPGEAAVQAATFANQRRADSLCIHADTPGVIDVAHHVRRVLEAGGFRVAASLSP